MSSILLIQGRVIAYGCGPFQADNLWLTELFDKVESDINQMAWPSQPAELSIQLYTNERFWTDFIELSNTIIKAPTEGMSLGKLMFVPPGQFQRLAEYLARHAEAVMVVHGPKPY